MDRPIVPFASSAAFSVILAYGVSKLLRIGSREPQLPPGPPTVPLLGNLTILPIKESFLKFTEWASLYGGVYSLKVGHQTMIVISSAQAIYEILEKNGAITADRPPLEAIRRFTGPTGMIGFTSHGSMWRKMRKAVTELTKPSLRLHHRPILVAEVSQLLYDTSENPLDLYHHLRRFGISLLFSIVGGVRVQHVNSDLCIKYFELLRMVAAISEPGNAPPVELLPILNYVPDMFVRNWKARCAMIDNKFQGILSSMVDSSEKRLKEGCPNDCFIEMMMRNREEWDLDRETIIGITGGLALGGVVTITSLLQFMVLLAVAHPQFQRKVHEELDRVIGVDRTPTLDDMPSLPYLNAFIRETQRFRITGPLGIPHFAQEDQFYGGYLIPKGSTLIMNLWGALHDPAVFDDPDSFDPERFIRSPHGIKSGAEETISAEAMKRLETLNFGAGRRKCVGLPMAVDVLVIAAANLFWAFEFCHLVNDYGEKTEADLWAFTSGSSNDPLPFKCKTRSRSQGHVEIIKQNFADSLPLFEMFQRELPEGNGSYASKS